MLTAGAPVGQATFTVRRTRRRGISRRVGVLGGPGQEARGWWRLLHAGEQQAVVGQGVDVAAEGPVDEGDEDVLLDLLDGRVLAEVGADAPVLLGRIEDLIVDPAAVGRLEQRVVEEEEEPAPGFEDPGHLGDGLVDRLDVLEDQAGDHAVEGGVAERQGGRAGPQVRRSPTARRSDGDLVPGRVEADDRGAGRGGEAGHLALARAHVEHPGGALQVVGGEREDLLLVLGIDAGGEAVLPPVGVALPEIVGLGHDLPLTSASLPPAPEGAAQADQHPGPLGRGGAGVLEVGRHRATVNRSSCTAPGERPVACVGGRGSPVAVPDGSCQG